MHLEGEVEADEMSQEIHYLSDTTQSMHRSVVDDQLRFLCYKLCTLGSREGSKLPLVYCTLPLAVYITLKPYNQQP